MRSTAAVAPPAAPPAGWLPRAGSVLAVLARPGQESAELGGLLYAFRRAGADLALLCLTRGEASSVNSTWSARLEAVRPWELQLAAGVLGISQVTVASYPDGDLGRQPEAELGERIGRAIRKHAADLLLVIDPAASDAEDDGSAMDDAAMDDAAVAAAACVAAQRAGVPVLARTGPPGRVPGAWVIDLGPDAGTARAIQKAAAAAHESQSAALPALIRRLDRLDGREHLRWLVTPAWARPTPEIQEKTWPTVRPRPTAGTARKPPTTVTSLPWHRADTSC
jgi:LmbE family N-acetylglucosaminyl deacetylase